jgi:hypothetical protein
MTHREKVLNLLIALGRAVLFPEALAMFQLNPGEQLLPEEKEEESDA